MDEIALYLEIIDQGYLQPQVHIKAMYNFYRERGKTVETPLTAIHNWMRLEKDTPSLNSEQTKYLSTFLRAMEPQGVCRFCDLLKGFELTSTQAIFTLDMPEAGIRKVDDWLAEHIDYSAIQPFHRAIAYRVHR